MIKKLISIILFIFLTFSIGFASTTTESEKEKCIAPEFFANNFPEKYHCKFVAFINEIEDGFIGLQFPATEPQAQKFLNVVQNKFYKYSQEFPFFLGMEANVFDITEIGDTLRTALVLAVITVYRDGRFTTLRVWWEIREVQSTNKEQEKNKVPQLEQKIFRESERKSKAF